MVQKDIYHVLEISETTYDSLDNIDYQFEVVDHPDQLRSIIIELNKPRNSARLLAGYCWEWLKAQKKNKDYYDIQIDSFEMSWNLDDTKTYVIDHDSVDQVACIHTAQGLEMDYLGVIIGDDMRYEDGRIITDFTKRAKTDNSLRGMKGCYIYCTDSNLGEYLKKAAERR